MASTSINVTPPTKRYFYFDIKRNRNIEKNKNKLIIKKDEFEKQINDSILEGEKLIDIAVKNKYFNSRDNEIEKNNFIFEYDIWNKFNIKFLENSFNTHYNEYIEKYNNVVHSSFDSNPTKYKIHINISDLTQTIRERVFFLKSLIKMLQFIPTISKNKEVTSKTTPKFTNEHNKTNKKILFWTIISVLVAMIGIVIANWNKIF